MEIVYHLGAHCTDDGRIYSLLNRNRGRLQKTGVVAPHPNRFRPVIQDTLRTLDGEHAAEAVQELVLDSIIEEDHPSRIILSYPSFLGGARHAVGQDMLYPFTFDRTQRLRRLFSGSEVEFFIGVMNPATFLPACFRKMGADNFEAYAAQTDVRHLLWSDMIRRIREANPESTVTVWSNEDTPFVWPEIIQEMVGHDPLTRLRGVDRFVYSLLTDEGATRLKLYLKSHPPDTVSKRRRVIAAFLDRFGKEDALVEELDYPGWTPDLVDTLTDLYEEDLFRIEQMDGVRFIAP